MSVPAGFELRAPRPADLPAVGEVVVADELTGGGQSTLGEDFVRREWNELGFDLGSDAWVAVDTSATVVGYAQVRQAGPDLVGSWGVVHPDHRGRGLGSALFDQLERRAAALLAGEPAARFRHAANAGDDGVAQLLRARGLRPVRHFWHMQIDLEPGSVEPGPTPAGIDITGVEHFPAVHTVLTEAFVDDWGDYPGPYDRWAEEEVRSPGYDPTLWLLAWDAGRPVGALTATSASDRGWVEYLGVSPSHRGRGIAAALLRRSFALFGERGTPRVLVSVDAANPTGATGVYERAGMRTVKAWDVWER